MTELLGSQLPCATLHSPFPTAAICWSYTSCPTEQKLSHCINVHPYTYIYTFKHLTEMLYTWLPYRSRQACVKGALWSSGINAANGARGPRFASHILPTVQRP